MHRRLQRQFALPGGRLLARASRSDANPPSALPAIIGPTNNSIFNQKIPAAAAHRSVRRRGKSPRLCVRDRQCRAGAEERESSRLDQTLRSNSSQDHANATTATAAPELHRPRPASQRLIRLAQQRPDSQPQRHGQEPRRDSPQVAVQRRDPPRPRVAGRAAGRPRGTRPRPGLARPAPRSGMPTLPCGRASGRAVRPGLAHPHARVAAPTTSPTADMANAG